MVFQTRNINPLPQLVELKSLIAEGGDLPDRFGLEVELGIFEETILLDKATIAVSLVKALLSLQLDGLEMDEKTKLGVDHVPSRVVIKVASQSEVETGIEETKAYEVIGSGHISTLSQALKLSGSKSGKSTETAKASLKEARDLEFEHLPVKYVGNDTWRVTDPAGGVLDATYLNYDKLCDIVLKPGKPNRIRTTLSVHARSKDINAVVTTDGRFLSDRTTLNKERVIGILVAKTLHEVSGAGEFRGTVTFAGSVASDEG